MLGLETALSIVNKTMVETKSLSWAQVAERMSYMPATIARYTDHGRELVVGSPANLTVMNPTKTYRVDRDLVASRSRNTPFHGMELPGVITATFFRGSLSYEANKS
jgi:dihydroorotase